MAHLQPQRRDPAGQPRGRPGGVHERTAAPQRHRHEAATAPGGREIARRRGTACQSTRAGAGRGPPESSRPGGLSAGGGHRLARGGQDRPGRSARTGACAGLVGQRRDHPRHCGAGRGAGPVLAPGAPHPEARSDGPEGAVGPVDGAVLFPALHRHCHGRPVATALGALQPAFLQHRGVHPRTDGASWLGRPGEPGRSGAGPARRGAPDAWRNQRLCGGPEYPSGRWNRGVCQSATGHSGRRRGRQTLHRHAAGHHPAAPGRNQDQAPVPPVRCPERLQPGDCPVQLCRSAVHAHLPDGRHPGGHAVGLDRNAGPDHPAPGGDGLVWQRCRRARAVAGPGQQRQDAGHGQCIHGHSRRPAGLDPGHSECPACGGFSVAPPCRGGGCLRADCR